MCFCKVQIYSLQRYLNKISSRAFPWGFFRIALQEDIYSKLSPGNIPWERCLCVKAWSFIKKRDSPAQVLLCGIFQNTILHNTSGRLLLICKVHRGRFFKGGTGQWLVLMTATNEIGDYQHMNKWLNNLLIYKRQVLHHFFDKLKQRWGPFKTLFRILHYLQKNY